VISKHSKALRKKVGFRWRRDLAVAAQLAHRRSSIADEALAFTIFFHVEERGTPIARTPWHWAESNDSYCESTDSASEPFGAINLNSDSW
jgi:hypothetical protein